MAVEFLDRDQPLRAPAGALRSPAEVATALRTSRYVADLGLTTAVFLALDLPMPLLLEGEPGVGKTEVAKAIAQATGRQLIRLQCYEGIDASGALYEWNYPRQLLHMRTEAGAENDIFTWPYLLERPLLTALRAGSGTVLLIDEVDRADDAFEAFLLEFLSDFQITIPELGTIVASPPPVVVLTSNRTRDLHDALRRRCLYHWIDYPSQEREVEIVKLRAPDLPDALVQDVTRTVAGLRELELYKTPGVSETIVWARALAALGADHLDDAAISATLGAILKDRDDVTRLADRVVALLHARK
jgi:MoxR-like ATPase